MATPLAVLIVEDLESDAALIMRLLARAGYDVTFARVETPSELRAALQARAWDIVISDYSLPELDGPTALAIVKSSGLDLPFIMVSGTMGEETAVEMMRAGAHDYLMKDNLPRLIPAVARELGQAAARRERLQVAQALYDSEQRYRSLVEQIPAIVYLSPFPGVDLPPYVSPYCRQLGGYEPEELAVRGKWQETVHPDDRPRVVARLAQAVQTGETVRDEYRAFTRDGRMLWVQETYWTVRDGAGLPLYLQGIVFDITQRKQGEEQIRALNAELEARVERRTRELREAQAQLVRQEKLAVLGQLAGGVGHELRNPLAVINNAVYFLKLVQPDATPKVKAYLDIIGGEVHNAEKIIGDLLDFARIKSVDRQAIVVSELVADALVRFPAPEGVHVTVDLPPDLPAVYVDPRQVGQVLGNLLTNACQAMPDGGELTICGALAPGSGGPCPRPTGAADTGGPQSHVVLSVRDTGVGIPPENMARLFEPLFTTKTRGIGLGLAVSKKLIEANEGCIEVASAPGAGATFTLWLPALPALQHPA